MALKGPGNTLKKSPYGDPTKASPYGKLPTKTTKKPKKEKSSNQLAGSSSNGGAGEGVALKDVFGVLADENGRITSAKLRSYVKELGLDFTDEEVKDMMQVVDPGGKGEVSYNSLLGVVRDFSHEFPAVKLTEEELTRELTSVSTITASSTQENNAKDAQEEPSTSVQNVTNTETVEKTDSESGEAEVSRPKTDSESGEAEVSRPKTDSESGEAEVSRPKSSRERIAEIAKRVIEDLDDKMSVIREDEEFENSENEDANEEPDNEDNKEEHNNEENEENVVNEEVKQEQEEEVNVKENDKETDSNGDNKLTIPMEETINSPLPSEGTYVSTGEKSESEEAKDGNTTEPEYANRSNLSTRASTVEIHRLDSAISTAVGRERVRLGEEADNKDRNSRRRSVSQTRSRSRKGSVQKDPTRKTNRSRERSKSRSSKSEENKKQIVTEQRKSVPRKKFSGVNDPNFYSTMGCSLKLSQIRTRQRILYVMWRAVYDDALRKMEQENAKLKAKRKTSRT